MLVLGRTNDEKGSQLEALTHTLLRAIGCSRVVRNQVSSGGEEIDVIAELPAPGLTGSYTTTLLCECKAHRAPIGMSDWLKFLGKIFSEELRTGGRVRAYFIALGGVNGNVAGHYEDVHRGRDDVMLLTADDLIGTMQQHFGVCDLEYLNAVLRRSTYRQVRSVESVYFDGAVSWVCVFEAGAYTLLSGDGSPIGTERLPILMQLVEDATSAHPFVDLAAEAAARERAEMTEKALLASFIARWELSDESLEAEPTEVASSDEINLALERLRKRGWILSKADDAATSSETPVRSAERIPEVYRFMLTGPIPGEVARLFGTTQHKEMVRSTLLDAVISIQGGLALSDEEREDSLKVLQWSPSALAWALNPVEFLINSRPQPGWDADERERFERARTDFFLHRLLEHLSWDFRRRGTRALFLKVHGIRTIETTDRVVVSGAAGILLDRTLTERVRLGVLADDYRATDGTSVVNMIMVEEDT